MDVILLRGRKLEHALGLVVDGLQRQIAVTQELTHAAVALARAATEYRIAIDHRIERLCEGKPRHRP